MMQFSSDEELHVNKPEICCIFEWLTTEAIQTLPIVNLAKHSLKINISVASLFK